MSEIGEYRLAQPVKAPSIERPGSGNQSQQKITDVIRSIKEQFFRKERPNPEQIGRLREMRNFVTGGQHNPDLQAELNLSKWYERMGNTRSTKETMSLIEELYRRQNDSLNLSFKKDFPSLAGKVRRTLALQRLENDRQDKIWPTPLPETSEELLDKSPQDILGECIGEYLTEHTNEQTDNASSLKI